MVPPVDNLVENLWKQLVFVWNTLMGLLTPPLLP